MTCPSMHLSGEGRCPEQGRRTGEGRTTSPSGGSGCVLVQEAGEGRPEERRAPAPV